MCKELEMEDFITLTLDDDSELECFVIGIFEADGREYIALLPDNEEEENDPLLYRYSEGEEGEPILENIETDEEYEIVADAFDEFLDTLEFEEMEEEEE